MLWWNHRWEMVRNAESMIDLLSYPRGRVTGPLCGEFPSQMSVTRSFDVFFDLRLNKRSSKQSRRWWFETPLRSLWRHCNATAKYLVQLFFIAALMLKYSHAYMVSYRTVRVLNEGLLLASTRVWYLFATNAISKVYWTNYIYKDIVTWQCFPHYLLLVRRNHRSSVDRQFSLKWRHMSVMVSQITNTLIVCLKTNNK